jgi:general secretion pathway protein A
MYERFFGLRERPFDLKPDPRFLFLSPRHLEALTHLKYGLSGRPGITMLVGDAGTGKSTLLRATINAINDGASRIAVLSNPTLKRDEFYEHLAAELGFSAEAAASKVAFLRELEAALESCAQRGGFVGLIVDEAQSLPDELLEELRLLTNAGDDLNRSLTLVLAGQPELADRLNDPALRQLKQRVALRAELAPFSLKETAGYIATRITTAGGRADQLFSRDAVITIHEASNGLPRIISVLCDNALVNGFAAGVRPVGSAIVAEVCANFDIQLVSETVGNVVQSTPAPAEVKAAAVAPSHAPVQELATPPETQTSTQSMFGSYQGPKRFSFFRGARQ